MSNSYVVGEDEGGRLDRWLRKRFPDSPRREIERLLERGLVLVEGRKAAKGHPVAAGATILLEQLPPTRAESGPQPEALPLGVLHVDEDLVAVDKPPGIPTHPLWANELGTAANRLVERFPECAAASTDPREGGAVHRLDRGTSGVLVFARSTSAHERLRKAFSGGNVRKTYLALCSAAPNSERIDVPLQARGGLAVPSPDGLPAMTELTSIARSGSYELIRCTSRSGRMHQIRAHLAHANAPIVGDSDYGGEPAPHSLIDFFLHAESVIFGTVEGRCIHAPLPEDRRRTLDALGFGSLELGPADVEQ